MIKKLSARCASVRSIELKYLSVSHLIKSKNIGSVESMRSCLVAYVRGWCDTFAKKPEIRVVIKYVCKKEMPPKEIHEDFMETLREEYPS